MLPKKKKNHSTYHSPSMQWLFLKEESTRKTLSEWDSKQNSHILYRCTKFYSILLLLQKKKHLPDIRPVMDDDCPSPTDSAFSSKSRTSSLISVFWFGMSVLVHALTKSALRSSNVEDDDDDTSDGTEENKAVLKVFLSGVNAEASRNMTTTIVDRSRIINN